jgi:hypothetical protein
MTLTQQPLDDLKIVLSAREIKHIVQRIRKGERDQAQGLIDIVNQADFILRQCFHTPPPPMVDEPPDNVKMIY